MSGWKGRWVAILTLLTPFHPSILPSGSAAAEVEPVALRVPEATAWTGQRIPIYVDVRTRGSFGGATSFSLPQIPRTVIMRIENPVISSQQIEGETWFVQTHEFALFSQQTGHVRIPPFEVRYGTREGFTGPVRDVSAEVPGTGVAIRRPPDSEQLGFLITTVSLEVSERWNPEPGPAEVGAVFKRTIVQRAPDLPGMALAPAPNSSPDGIRVYPGQVEVNDRLARGEFLGERRETITYLLERPGELTIPELRYAWWNPRTESLETKTLPAVSFEASALAASSGKVTHHSARWPWWVMVGLVTGGLAWQRRRIGVWARARWKRLNPPDKVAARQLLGACRTHKADEAQTAWSRWCRTRDRAYQPGPALYAAVLEMQRSLFGPSFNEVWRGDALARAFCEDLGTLRSPSSGQTASTLPSLNP